MFQNERDFHALCTPVRKHIAIEIVIKLKLQESFLNSKHCSNDMIKIQTHDQLIHSVQLSEYKCEFLAMKCTLEDLPLT